MENTFNIELAAAAEGPDTEEDKKKLLHEFSFWNHISPEKKH